MTITAPVPIPAAPPVPDSSLAGDVEFDLAYEASISHQRNVLIPGVNALSEATYLNALSALQSAEEAEGSAEVVNLALGAAEWAAGARAKGACVWSPLDLQTYRCKATGTYSVDPSLDDDHWALIGRRAVGRNYLTNAGFFVHQSDVTTSQSAGDWGRAVDRWAVRPVGGSSNTSRVMSSTHPQSRTSLRVAMSSGGTSFGLRQRIELSQATVLGGSLVAFSAWLYHTAGDGVTAQLSAARAETDVFSSTTAEFATAAVSVPSGVWTRVVFSGALSQHVRLGLEVVLTVAGPLGGASVELTCLKLEQGRHATPFEPAPAELELRECERFFLRRSFWAGECAALGFARSATQMQCRWQFPVGMRVAPTMQIGTGAASWSVQAGAATVTPSAISAAATNRFAALITATVSGVTAGAGGGLFGAGTSTPWIEANAEL